MDDTHAQPSQGSSGTTKDTVASTTVMESEDVVSAAPASDALASADVPKKKPAENKEESGASSTLENVASSCFIMAATVARSRNRKKRAHPPSPFTSSTVANVQVKAEPDDESTSITMAPSLAERKEEEQNEESGNENHEIAPSIAMGVSTRRSKSRQQALEEKEEGSNACADEGESGSDSDSSTERSRSSATTSPNSLAHSTSRVRSKNDEILERVTQAAIQAQERQLRHTLLSIFPPHLRAMRVDSAPQQSQDNESKSSTAGPHISLPTNCSPEPLLPLLNALCEDKAYVHAAWCRYEDDLAVQRAQSILQRIRQRRSINKVPRKRAPWTTATVTAISLTGPSSGVTTDRVKRDKEEGDSNNFDDDEHQPPESEWVEAAPALTGHHGTVAASSADRMHTGTQKATASGFQWTPWRFFRAKRRRSTHRFQTNADGVMSSATAAAVSSPTSQRNSTTSNTSRSALNTSAAVTPTAAAASTKTTSSVLADVGGVPSLLVSEVPSLPVLQVDTDVPNDVTAAVEAMTDEEQQNYARYVMSSGKLRHICRDPYAFLVSRAKEMRIQWERQHPFV